MKNKILTMTFVISVTSSALCAFSLSDFTNAFSSTDTVTPVTPTTKATTKATTTSNLTSMLTNQLGITNKQSAGGLGSILTYAKGVLPTNKFSTLSSAVPNATSLMKMAPNSHSNSLSSLTGSLGQGSSATQLASLASQFSSLGMSSDMISKFIPIIVNYFKGSGATGASSILSGLF